MDVLVLENCVPYKTDQKPLEGDSNWKKEFEQDYLCLLHGLWPDTESKVPTQLLVKLYL
jgi:hypothetical protein